MSELSVILNECIEAMMIDPKSLSSQMKIHSVLSLLNEMDNYALEFNNLIAFLLQLKPIEISSESKHEYDTLLAKIIPLLNSEPIKIAEASKEEYYDHNLANAIKPLSEIENRIHKAGDIVYFIEHKYVDATGRKFMWNEFPKYNVQTAILQNNIFNALEGR